MITKFKLFENINEGVPEVGDWVIINSDHEIFYKDKIGTIEDIDNEDINDPIYYIYYPNSTNVWRPCTILNVEYWSKNKEVLEVILQSKKYNV